MWSITVSSNIVRGLSTCSYATLHKAYEMNTTAKNRNVGVAKRPLMAAIHESRDLVSEAMGPWLD